MNKFIHWLSNTAKLRSLFYVIPIIIILHLGYALWISSLYLKLDVWNKMPTSETKLSDITYLKFGVYSTIEEITFRLFPFLFFITYRNDINTNKKYLPHVLILVILTSSLLFGVAHGSILSIGIQGVSGIFL